MAKEDKWKDHKMTEDKFNLPSKAQKRLDRMVKETKAKTGPHGFPIKRLNKLVKDDEDFF